MGDSNQLFESLFRPKIGDAGEIAFLKQLTADHPYFSPAQFYLLERTNENDPAYAEQAAKTALLFNNHFWLNFQLQEARDNRLALTGSKDVVMEEQIVPLENEAPESVPMDESSSNLLKDLDGQAETGPNAAAESVAHVDGQVEIETVVGKPEQEQAAINGDISTATDSEHPHDLANEILAVEEPPFVEDYPEAVVDPEPVTGETNPDSFEQELTGSPALEDKTVEAGLPPIEEAVHPMDDEEAEIDPEEQKELAPLHVKLHLQEPSPASDTLTFEPLHTTDYFASQGIRLSNEIQSTDKLGKQLKSFTEWLKTMKKIHTEQPSDNINLTDVTIQKLAEKSNTEDDVVTEAMADVLVQQGKGSKAREVYRKLSLLNPAKTAYFAAKIDQLKEQ